MIEFLKRLRRIWLMGARHTNPNALPTLIADGVVTIGKYTYGEPKVAIWTSPVHGRIGGKVSIGSYCSIGGDVTILTAGNHPIRAVSTFPLRHTFDLPGRDDDLSSASKGDIVVGDDVWIGYGVTILSGVTIGAGAAIGAHAVVSRDVAPYAIVAGNPAREVRRRFTDEQIDGLLRVAWWDWPEEKVRENVDLILSEDVDAFLRAHGG